MSTESESFREVANQLRRTPDTDAAAEDAQRQRSSWDYLLAHARVQERQNNSYRRLLREAHEIIGAFAMNIPAQAGGRFTDLLRRVDLLLGVWGGGCPVPGRHLLVEHFERGSNLEMFFQALLDGWGLTDPPGEKFRDAFECGVGLIEHALQDGWYFDGDAAAPLNDPAGMRAAFKCAFQAGHGDALGEMTADLCEGLAVYRESLPAGFSVSFIARQQPASASLDKGWNSHLRVTATSVSD